MRWPFFRIMTSKRSKIYTVNCAEVRTDTVLDPSKNPRLWPDREAPNHTPNTAIETL